MGYELEGRMAEVCTCESLCPCAVGLDPDGQVCEFSWVFHFDRGTVDGTDVADLNLGLIGRLDGGPSNGTVRAAIYMDERATDAQEAAIMAAFTGQLGGPLADLASLIGEVVTTQRVAIEFDVDKGSGTFRTGDVTSGRIEALRNPEGLPTTMSDFALAPLGSKLYAGLPTEFTLNASDIGFDFQPNSGTQFEFHHVVA